MTHQSFNSFTKKNLNFFLIFIFIFSLSTSAQQNIGVGTATPKTKLDVNGSIAWREGPALILVNGVNTDIVIGTNSFFRITGPTTAFSINGFTGGVDGRI